MLKMIKWSYSGFLSYSFSDFLKSAWLLLVEKSKGGKVSNNFCWNSSAEIPYVTFQVVSKDFPVTSFWEHSCCVYVDPWAVPVYTHSIRSRRSDKQRRLIKVYIHTWCLILTGAGSNPVTHPDSCLQSSVVHFVVAVKSFPSAVALFSPFGVFPQRKQTNNRPFPLHFSWCWTSKGGSQRSWNILLEWYFESCSPRCFFLSHDEILGCCNNSACVCACVWKKTAHTESKDNSKLQLNDRLGALVFWIALFSFYSCFGGGLVGVKKAQMGHKASSLVSGELPSAQTKIAVIFCWQTLFNARVLF